MSAIVRTGAVGKNRPVNANIGQIFGPIVAYWKLAHYIRSKRGGVPQYADPTRGETS